jgi:uncharacterized protein
MLVELRFKNFASFKDEQTLSLVASSDKELLERNTLHPGPLGKNRLVRSAVVYGPNASGKTNLIRVLSFIKEFVTGAANRELEESIPVTPFKLDAASAQSPSEFELTFIHDAVRYQYGFAVDRKRVYQEWLLAYPKGSPQRWFERHWNGAAGEYDWYFGSHLKGEKAKMAQMTRANAPFLSIGAQFNHPQLTSVYEWFSRYLRTIDGDGGNLTVVTARMANEDEMLKKKIVQLLQSSDMGIADFSITERILKDFDPDMLPTGIPSRFLHLIGSREGELHLLDIGVFHRAVDNVSDQVRFSLREESNGTQRLFAFGGPWLDTLAKGYVLAVDELDSSLHPLLVRGLIDLFHSSESNEKDAQLIFNTHDTTLLDADLFRRDQVWFVEKDSGGASHLYPLLDFSPRKTEALGKGYLMGRYGAIPVMSELRLSEDTPCYG